VDFVGHLHNAHSLSTAAGLTPQLASGFGPSSRFFVCMPLQIFANNLAAESSVAEIVFDGQPLQQFKVGRFEWDCNGAC
jgi:hypothetical protein